MRGGDVTGLKLLSPEYVAVMVCLPLLRLDVLKVLMCESQGTVPSVFVPSRKVTVPLILPASIWLPLTVRCTSAVKVTSSPTVDGFGELVRLATVPRVLRSTATP